MMGCIAAKRFAHAVIQQMHAINHVSMCGKNHSISCPDNNNKTKRIEKNIIRQNSEELISSVECHFPDSRFQTSAGLRPLRNDF